jgi:hypothetical protein
MLTWLLSLSFAGVVAMAVSLLALLVVLFYHVAMNYQERNSGADGAWGMCC